MNCADLYSEGKKFVLEKIQNLTTSDLKKLVQKTEDEKINLLTKSLMNV